MMLGGDGFKEEMELLHHHRGNPNGTLNSTRSSVALVTHIYLHN